MGHKFDEAIDKFELACVSSANIHSFFGAAYRTRLDAAFANVKAAYNAACKADDEELGKGEGK